MRPTSIAFASALMLGGMSMAYAQDGPGKDRERPSQTQEQTGQSRGADRGQADTNSDRGSSAERSESRASRSGGDERSQSGNENKAAQGQQRSSDEQGQRTPRQAQEKSGSANEDRASRKGDADQASRKDQSSDRKAQRDDDDNRKSADRRDSDDQTRSSQSRDDNDRQRAATQKDDDAKRAESRDRQGQDRDDAQRADRKDRDRDDAQRADRRDRDSDHKSARVELQGDKKERVRTAFREHSHVKERTNVDIDISVGRSLPRDWDYYPVPASIIEVVPEYRDYRYVYVEDRYVIVDPSTYQVVTVIDAGGSGGTTTASRGPCSSDLTLSAADRDYLLKSVQMRNEVDVTGVSIGWRVPDTVELETFPAPVTSRISGLSSCRYFVVDDRIAIVDPDQHNVVILVQD